MTEEQTTAPIDFSDMVKVLAKSGADILASLTADDCHSLHMVLGMGGEVGELIVVSGIDNLIEELGDYGFYFEGLRQRYGFEIESIRELSDFPYLYQLTHLDNLQLATGNIIDAVKKEVLYRKPIDLHALLQHMRSANLALAHLRDANAITADQVIAANIAKLGKRYNGFKYSNEAAQARADKPVGE